MSAATFRRIVLALLLAAVPTLLVASFYANGELVVRIEKIEGPVSVAVPGELWQVPVRLHVLRCLRGGGHAPEMAKAFVGKTIHVPLCFRSEAAAKALKVITVMTNTWYTSNGLGFDPKTGEVKETGGSRWYGYTM